MKNFMRAREVNSSLFLGLVILLVAFTNRDRMSIVVLVIAIALGAAFGVVGAVQTRRGTVTKTNQVNSNIFLGIMIVLVVISLGDRISDGVLAIALGIGLTLQTVGLYQQLGKARKL